MEIVREPKGENQTVGMSGFSETELPGDVRTAVFRGKKHVRKNMPCQDACAAGITGDGWIVMAVADGVSSSPSSEKAAHAAVKAAVTFWKEFKTCFQGAEEIAPVLRASMNYALMETDRISKDSNEPYGFETTLLIVLVNWAKQEMYYTYVGDGGIYVLTKEERVDRLTDIMRDEEESVYTLSTGPGKWKTGSRDLSDISSILVFTDGISDVINSAGRDFGAAKLFVNRENVSSPEDFRDHCRRVLAEPPFLNIDDDVAIVLCKLGEVSEAPWNVEEPPEQGLRRSGREKETAESREFSNNDARRGIKNVIIDVFKSIRNSRRNE